MAFVGAWGIANYPLTPGQTTVVQNVGIAAKTFTTGPTLYEVDSVTYTPTSGAPITFNYYPCMMGPEDLLSLLRAAGVTDATIGSQGRLILPSGSTLTGSTYLG